MRFGVNLILEEQFENIFPGFISILKNEAKLSSCYYKVAALLLTPDGEIVSKGRNGSFPDVIECNEMTEFLKLLVKHLNRDSSIGEAIFKALEESRVLFYFEEGLNQLYNFEESTYKFQETFVKPLLEEDNLERFLERLEKLKEETYYSLQNEFVREKITEVKRDYFSLTLRGEYCQETYRFRKTFYRLPLNIEILKRQTEILKIFEFDKLKEIDIYDESSIFTLLKLNYVHSTLELHAEKNIIKKITEKNLDLSKYNELYLLITHTPCFECAKQLLTIPNLKKIFILNDYFHSACLNKYSFLPELDKSLCNAEFLFTLSNVEVYKLI